MPIFEFHCAACNYRFEEIMSSSASDPEQCPRCGKTEVKRLMSAHSVGSSASAIPCSDCGVSSACGSNGCGPGSGSCPFS